MLTPLQLTVGRPPPDLVKLGVKDVILRHLPKGFLVIERIPGGVRGGWRRGGGHQHQLLCTATVGG